MDTINAHINKIIYKASDSNFTICNFDIEDEYIDLTAKGKMTIEEGNNYIFTGEFKDDERYGEYFAVNMCERVKLTDGEDIINYLTSKRFTGIGKRTAKKIYEALGENSLEIIENEPSKLENIGISENIIKELTTKHSAQNIHAKLYELLTPIRLSDFVISNLYDYIETNKLSNYVSMIETNPYEYIEHVYGYTFEIADQIYLYFNPDDNEKYIRISNSIKYYIYNKCFEKGDTKIKSDNVIKYIANTLNLDINIINDVISEMLANNEVFLEDEYLINDIFMENITQLGDNLVLRQAIGSEEFEEFQLSSQIDSLQDLYKINYSDIQQEAIKNALNSNISIITGGPGTGKTTIIKAIANIFCSLHNYETDKDSKVLLCAPTGRAAQRMFEATKFTSKTIHSALRWDPHNGTFAVNEEDSLEAELIIIDEFSMVDLFVANALFKAIRPYAKIIIVGDPAQLESVGPGSILRDLIDSELVNVTKLDVIYRQGEGSTIANLARQIDLGDKLELINTNDMSVINRQGNLVPFVKQIVSKSKNANYNDSEIQVLYPKYKGTNGIDNINKELKPELTTDYLTANNTQYQIGDKVMQLKNNYEKEIYNGDIGFITKIYSDDAKGTQLAIEVDFDRIKVDLSRKDLDEITHAYAISIHKSQGSEFKIIVIPVSSESRNMLSKKLIYTAITRAKDKLILIGDMTYLDTGLNLADYTRNTFLVQYLKRRII